MNLLERITYDYKEAMKQKDEIKKLVLNLILAKIKNKKIELQKDLEDIDIVAIIKKEVKEILETIWFLQQAHKLDDIVLEEQKKTLLEFYLPATMTKEQTREILLQLIQDHAITDLRTQRWILMKALMTQYKTELDTQLVNELINEMIA